MMSFRFETSLYEALRLYAFNNRTSMTDVVLDAIDEYFTKRGIIWK